MPTAIIGFGDLDGQQAKLTRVAKNDLRLHPAHLFKVGLRLVFQFGYDALETWIAWARRRRNLRLLSRDWC